MKTRKIYHVYVSVYYSTDEGRLFNVGRKKEFIILHIRKKHSTFSTEGFIILRICLNYSMITEKEKVHYSTGIGNGRLFYNLSKRFTVSRQKIFLFLL
jgi:hypothetical protein